MPDEQRVPRVGGDYNPNTVTIRLDTRDDKVLASVHSVLYTFGSSSQGDIEGQNRTDRVVEFTATDFEEKFEGDYITFEQFYEDARAAQELLDRRSDFYFAGDDEPNLERARDFVDRYEEIERDFTDFRAEYVRGLEENGRSIPPETLKPIKLPDLGQ